MLERLSIVKTSACARKCLALTSGPLGRKLMLGLVLERLGKDGLGRTGADPVTFRSKVGRSTVKLPPPSIDSDRHLRLDALVAVAFYAL